MVDTAATLTAVAVAVAVAIALASADAVALIAPRCTSMGTCVVPVRLFGRPIVANFDMVLLGGRYVVVVMGGEGQ